MKPFSNRELPLPAMEKAITLGQLPPPFYLPIEAPPCGEETDGADIAGIPPRLVCDRPKGHLDPSHREVTDAIRGHTVEWTVMILTRPRDLEGNR